MMSMGRWIVILDGREKSGDERSEVGLVEDSGVEEKNKRCNGKPKLTTTREKKMQWSGGGDEKAG